MKFLTNLFSPDTYEAFGRSDRNVAGFLSRHLAQARSVKIGDRLICYMTKMSRWVGVLEILGDCYTDDTPIFYTQNDPYIVRFKVNPVVWFPVERAIPIRDKVVWDTLSFTKGIEQRSSLWTGPVRSSLNKLSYEDGTFLQGQLIAQQTAGQSYSFDEDEYRRLLAQRIRRLDKVVQVSVPIEDQTEEPDESEVRTQSVRESSRIQALVAALGEKMGFKVWIPKADRPAVLREWDPLDGTLLSALPLSYDEPTIQTIEQIDVLWLRGRAIIRAFEIEHTTAVYSGILRMADLLALQPNMDIKLHIVAPEARRSKVMNEIQRPVFSLLEKGPLSEYCTFLAYGSLKELMEFRHIQYLSDGVLEEYAEGPE